MARLPRKPGRQDHEYMHLFSGEIESAPEDPGTSQRLATPRREDRLDALEKRVDRLEKALVQLADRLGETLDP